MKNWDLTRSAILAAPIPTATESYTPIPHSVFLEEVQEELDKKNYIIKSEKYLSTKDFGILTGQLVIGVKGENYTELAPSISLVNSYNKMRKASIHASAAVLVCKNGMIGSVEKGSYTRKHSGNALEEFREHIAIVVDNIGQEFERLTKNMNEMKAIEVDKATIAQLIGDMYLNESLVTSTQLSIIKHELEFSSNFKDGTLWSLYNNCTEAFKDNHPLNYDKQHIKLHTYISDKFGLSGHRGLYGGELQVAGGFEPLL